MEVVGHKAYFAVAEVVWILAYFNNCYVYAFAVSHEAIANHLCHVAEVNVSIFYFTFVDSFAEGAVGLIRQAAVHNASFYHCLVNFQGPTEAPVQTLTLKSVPLYLSDRARGTAFG